jgi:hypothetical protein
MLETKSAPNDLLQLLIEYKSLSKDLRVKEVLKHLTVAIESLSAATPREIAGLAFYIFVLKLNSAEDTKMIGFKSSVQASEDYAELEKDHISDPMTQLVLVSGDSVFGLRKAYPNYFRDTAAFVGIMEEIDRIWDKYEGSIKAELNIEGSQ